MGDVLLAVHLTSTSLGPRHVYSPQSLSISHLCGCMENSYWGDMIKDFAREGKLLKAPWGQLFRGPVRERSLFSPHLCRFTACLSQLEMSELQGLCSYS